MSLVVVGSVAFDGIQTPDGARPENARGSAVHFSMAASYFGGVQLVGVVGEDFPTVIVNDVFRGICLDGLEVVTGGETFRWSGKYSMTWTTVKLSVLISMSSKTCRIFRLPIVIPGSFLETELR